MRLAAAALALLTTAGCASLGRAAFQQPRVEIVDAKLVGVGTQGGTLDIGVSIYNPNSYALDADRFNYRVVVEDSIEVAKGVIDQRVRVNQRDSATVRVPVTFSVVEAMKVFSTASRRGALEYRLQGDFRLRTGAGRYTRDFDQKGLVTLSDILR
jgi:LEA14-like dessication related protein